MFQRKHREVSEPALRQHKGRCIFFFMKRLVSQSTVLIVSTPRFSRGRVRDPWPSHAVIYFGTDQSQTASGLYVWAPKFRLKSGEDFYYPVQLFVTEQEKFNFQDRQFWPPNYFCPVEAFGEFYNWGVRNFTTDKVANSDWLAWLASH